MTDEVASPGVYMVPVVKAKGQFVEVNIEQLPDASFRGIVASGLKAAINSGATKIVQDETDAEGKKAYSESAKAAALELASKKAQELISGTFKFGRGGTATSEMPHKVVVRARQLARDAIKAAIKDAGDRVTNYKASAITEAANRLLADEERGKWFYDKAKEEIELESKKPSGPSIKGFSLGISADPELIKKNTKKAKVDTDQLSAAVASRTSTSKAALHKGLN